MTKLQLIMSWSLVISNQINKMFNKAEIYLMEKVGEGKEK